MTRPPWPILYEDNHLLVINKPAMLPTMGVPDGVESLLTQAKEYIKRRYDKPGNVYLGIVSRLDTPVTGVIVLARTSKAASRLTEQYRSRQAKKTYLALVPGTLAPSQSTLTDYLAKDERHRKMHLSRAGQPGAQEARLHYRVHSRIGRFSLVEVELETGRKHQIRVQLASAGHAIVGDRKYGSQEHFAKGIALHAWRLELDHPVLHEPLTFVAPLPPTWRNLGVSL